MAPNGLKKKAKNSKWGYRFAKIRAIITDKHNYFIIFYAQKI